MDGVFDRPAATSPFSPGRRDCGLPCPAPIWISAYPQGTPGTTVYLCLSGDDIDTYKPIVRLIIQQHANLLLRNTGFRAADDLLSR